MALPIAELIPKISVVFIILETTIHKKSFRILFYFQFLLNSIHNAVYLTTFFKNTS